MVNPVGVEFQGVVGLFFQGGATPAGAVFAIAPLNGPFQVFQANHGPVLGLHIPLPRRARSVTEAVEKNFSVLQWGKHGSTNVSPFHNHTAIDAVLLLLF